MNYDAIKRKPEARKFYNSAAWKRCRGSKLANQPWCEYVRPGQTDQCGELAQHVHHLKPIATPEGWERRLEINGLLSVCIPCHNMAEAQGEVYPVVAGTLELSEDETYFFDEDASTKPIRFIEKFCQHYVKGLVGQPFLLHPVQKKIIAEIYGYKNRETGLRRFNRVWWEGAIGCGKSPLLAAIGVFELVAGGEPANEIYCVATNYKQARIIFDVAKTFIKNSPVLAARCTILHGEIRCPSSGATWSIISGIGPKAGMRPGAVFGDECHQWKSAEAYDDLQGRMTKRTEPIFWIATNAAEERYGIYAQLHDEAVAVLTGKKKDDQLYPILWASDSKEIDNPAAWRAANPLLGVTVKQDKVQQECNRAIGSPSLEARFRRLYLGQRVQDVNTWIDVDRRWTPNQKTFEIPAEAPLYVGCDLSEGDDLVSLAFVWPTPERFYVRSHHWICRDVAEQYERDDQVPYSKWEAAGHITLVDELTIDGTVRRRIARYALNQHGKPEKFCFDRYRADETKAIMEAAGVECVPIGQGWGTSPGVTELNNRLKSNTIDIEPNDVMTFAAGNAQLKSDDRGNSWIVKPSAKKTYAGTRWKKVDPLTALVTALTKAREHNFPAASKKWQGTVVSI